MKKNPNKSLIVSLIVLGVVIIVVGSYFTFNHEKIGTKDGNHRVLCPFAKEVDQSALSKYDGVAYSMQYPPKYQLIPATKDYSVATLLTLDNKKVMEIWKPKDFPGGDRPIGVEGEELLTQAESDSLIPKENLTLINDNAEYVVNLFYSKTDSVTKAALHVIYNSIKLK